MFRLASILYSIVGTSLAGSLIILTLTLGYDTLTPILSAAFVGAVIAVPVAYFIAQAIVRNKR